MHADGLNAVIEIPDPDNGYYEPGDTIAVRLTMTDDDDNSLTIDEYRQNGLRTIEMWVSGPRQEYLSVEPYIEMIILDRSGVHEESGINPETCEIPLILPDYDELDTPGTFSILFEIVRRSDGETLTALPVLDFQVDQIEVTETPSLMYITCSGDGCHNPLNTDATHTSSNLNTCIICHTRDYELPWNGFMHEFRCHDCEEFEPVNSCHLCHLANAGIDNFSHTGCFSSCHSYDDTPEDHTEYREDVCILCHYDEQSVYATHEEFEPHPPQQFNLIFPEDNAVIDSMPMVFSWQASHDDDQDDILRYHIELSQDEDFEDFRILRAGDSTSFAFYFYDLEFNTDYYWRVHAVDLNSGGTYSDETRMFLTTVWQVREEAVNRAVGFSIQAAYPNPFNSSTTITYGIGKPGPTRLALYDLSGREVRTLFDGYRQAGFHSVNLSTGDLSSGLYFVGLEGSGQTIVRKLMLIK